MKLTITELKRLVAKLQSDCHALTAERDELKNERDMLATYNLGANKENIRIVGTINSLVKKRDLLMDDAKVMAVEILGLHDSECTDTDETKDCLEELGDCDGCEWLNPCNCPACDVARKHIK